MKIQRRWIFNLLTASSLLLALFLCYLYLRSQRTADFVSWNRWRNATTHDHFDAMVHWGRIRFSKILIVKKQAEEHSRTSSVSHTARALGGSDYDKYVESFRTGRRGSRFAKYPLGIWTYRESVSYERNTWTETTTSVVIPVGWFIALSLILPLSFLLRFARRLHRRHRGLCPMCGYDLRASSGRCPECGHEAAPSAPREAGVSRSHTLPSD